MAKKIVGGQGRIRTFVRRKGGQIYSLLALTTHPPVLTLSRTTQRSAIILTSIEHAPRCALRKLNHAQRSGSRSSSFFQSSAPRAVRSLTAVQTSPALPHQSFFFRGTRGQKAARLKFSIAQPDHVAADAGIRPGIKEITYRFYATATRKRRFEQPRLRGLRS